MSDTLRFTSPVEIQAGADNTKPVAVHIRAYGGGVMTVPGFGPTAIDTAGLDASKPITLLVDHDAGIRGVLGPGQGRVEAGQVFVTGTISKASDLGAQIIALAKDGLKWQASCGVEITSRRFIHEGETVTANGRKIAADGGGFTLITKGILREVSIVALGADANTSVSIAASHRGVHHTMSDTDDHTTPTDATPLPTPSGSRRHGMQCTGTTRTRAAMRMRKMQCVRRGAAALRLWTSSARSRPRG
jgi:hypothetical protein